MKAMDFLPATVKNWLVPPRDEAEARVVREEQEAVLAGRRGRLLKVQEEIAAWEGVEWAIEKQRNEYERVKEGMVLEQDVNALLRLQGEARGLRVFVTTLDDLRAERDTLEGEIRDLERELAADAGRRARGDAGL